MNSRNWSIRTKITALVAVPLSALLALWIFATMLAAGPALHLLSARTLLDTVGKPGEALVAELQQERRLSVIYLAGSGDPGQLSTQRAATDRAVAAFRGTAGGDDAQGAAGDLLKARIGQVFTAAEGMSAGRGFIDRRGVDAIGAQNLYSSVIDGAFRMFAATATYDEPQIDRETRALITIGQGREWLSRADSLLAGAHAAGKFTGDQNGLLIEALGTQQYLYAEAVADLPADERTAYQRLTGGATYTRLLQMQNTLVRFSRAETAAPVTAESWQPAYDSTVQQLRAFELNATDSLADRAAPVALRILLLPALAGLLGLAALAVSVWVSVRVGRSLIGRLAHLRTSLEQAAEQLPLLVRRLRSGGDVDVEALNPPMDHGTDEVGALGNAFTKVRRIAVQSAVDEADVRRGLNDVFLNIARRSQTLLHRQLALLDAMERRETESQDLEDLYRVDHLATRMRRHAEDLVILAGAAPGRGWRNPVPVIDVVRGAISEVEDYKRIDVSPMQASSLLGRAVGDAIHLLAELLENAASFSPPNTRVHVTGQVLPNGYAVEIEDRGLGMTREALSDANRRLSEPPEFDPANSARLGLFVVARLAGRHQIQVQLKPSPYGGVTALVFIPAALVTAGGEPAPLPAGGPADDRSWDRPTVVASTAQPAPRLPLALRQREQPSLPAAATAATADSVAPDSADPQDVTAEGLAQRRRTVPRPRPPAAHVAQPVDEDDLPRRVRQANLVPQLRAPVQREPDAAARSPEDVRTRLSALQRGTTRGRLAAAQLAPTDTPGPADDGWGTAGTAGYPVTRDPPPQSPMTRTARSHGQPTQPEKDA